MSNGTVPYEMFSQMEDRAEAAEAERDRLAAQVERVRYLAKDWPCSDETCDGECSGCAYARDLLDAIDAPAEDQS